MIFVVGGSGGGGFSTKDAIIHVNAPLGSTVTFSKDNIAVKIIEPSKAITNSDGETADYYYSVKSSNYGSWTLTATAGNDTATETVTVNAIKQYDVILSFSLYLFKDGDKCRTITGGWEAAGYLSGPQGWGRGVPTVTEYSNFYEVSFLGNAGGAYATVGRVDVSKYSTLKAIVQHSNAWRGDSCFRFGMRDTKADGQWLPDNIYINLLSSPYKDTLNSDIELVIDISSYTGSYYVGFYSYNSSPNVINYFRKVWCEL